LRERSLGHFVRTSTAGMAERTSLRISNLLFVLPASFVLAGALVLNQPLRPRIYWFVSRKAGKGSKTSREDSAAE
jgi:hypothetical protein